MNDPTIKIIIAIAMLCVYILHKNRKTNKKTPANITFLFSIKSVKEFT